jgi:eukaryotic-like serine/threonine-protein kinase
MHEDPPSIGSTVGPWLLLERLDSGSFGVVFRARRASPPESPPVALKIAKRPGDPRFEREAEVLQRSHHPSIPRYEDSGQWTGPTGRSYPYVAMEWVKGSTLYPWFREKQRSSLDVLRVAVQLAEALASAHGRGVIHRDVKGENIRITPEGRAVLLDWGSCWWPSAMPLTDTPAPPGTHAYRPPEQRGFMHVSRMDTDARWESRPSDDLYALGVILYRLVTGNYLPPCTDGDGLVERKVIEPSAMATVSPALEALILRLISDDREARGTAEQLVRESMALVQASGPDAEKPILPTTNAMPTERGRASSDRQEEPVSGDSGPKPSQRPPSSRNPSAREERRPPEPVSAWLSWASASMVGALLMALVMLLVVRPAPAEPAPKPTPWLATPEEVAQFAPDAGVGEKALASVQDAPKAVLPALLSFGRPMPKTPLHGQRTPPCERGETAIHGACWVEVAREVPPCGDTMFDYDGRCFKASTNAPRQPTSEQP